MKTSLCLLLVVTLHTARAQVAPDSVPARRNILKFNPASLLFGQVSTFCERAITGRFSVVGGIGFGGQSYPYANNSTIVPSPGRFHYERLTLEGRYYIRGFRAPAGVYIGPYIRYARLSLNDYVFDTKGGFIRDQNGELVKEERRMTVVIPGLLGGWQTTIGRHLTFELFMGLQCQLPSSNKAYSPAMAEGMSTAGFVERIGLTTGYRF